MKTPLIGLPLNNLIWMNNLLSSGWRWGAQCPGNLGLEDDSCVLRDSLQSEPWYGMAEAALVSFALPSDEHPKQLHCPLPVSNGPFQSRLESAFNCKLNRPPNWGSNKCLGCQCWFWPLAGSIEPGPSPAFRDLSVLWASQPPFYVDSVAKQVVFVETWWN